MINVVCAVILDGDGRVLVCQRPEGKALAGKWEFPGGKIEPDEKPEAALCREIVEELGCTIEVGGAMAEVEYHYDDFSIRLQPYRARILAGAPVAIEHAQLRWLSLAECASLEWAEADVPIWKSLVGPGQCA